jgi:hypothetical protein
MENMVMLMGHLQAPAACPVPAPLTGEIACVVRLECGGRGWEVRLGVRFGAQARPHPMADAMAFAARRFKETFESWIYGRCYTHAGYETFVLRLLDEMNECFGPRYGVEFREVVVYGRETLALLVGAVGGEA